MRTSELATQAGVNVETLRYYERRGLLAVPDRTSTGYRCYPPDSVRRVQFVKRAQHVGFSLAEIAELLELADGGPASCATARSLAARRVDELRRRIVELAAMENALSRLLATCAQPRASRECPLIESLLNAAQVSAS